MSVQSLRGDIKFHVLALPVSISLLLPYVNQSVSMIRHMLPFYIIGINLIAHKKLIVPKSRFIFGMIALLSFGLINSLITEPSDYDLKFFLLLLSPIVGAFFFFEFAKLRVRQFIVHLFWMSILFQSIIIFTSQAALLDLGIFQLISRTESSFILNSANSDVESTFTFLFAYFAIYFIQSRKYLLLTLSVLMMLINYKRIVLMGFFCSVSFMLVVNYWIQFKRVRGLIWMLPAVMITFLMIFSSGSITKVFKDTFGLSINQLTTGRYEIQHELFERLFSFPQVIFGHGLGTTHENVAGFNFTEMTLAHSDYIVLFYDLGVIGFILFFIFLRKFLCSSMQQYAYAVFLLIVLAATNSIIFFDVMFLFYLLILVDFIPNHTNLPTNPIS